jgi:hypothetical protein
MFEGTGTVDSATALASLADALDQVGAIDWVGCPDDELLRALRGLEKIKRRLEFLDHGLVAEVDVRGMAGERGCASTTAMLGRLLRITRREASSRIRAARQLAPHRSLTGEDLPPAYPVLAAAHAEGGVSGEQARIITSTIEKERVKFAV